MGLAGSLLLLFGPLLLLSGFSKRQSHRAVFPEMAFWPPRAWLTGLGGSLNLANSIDPRAADRAEPWQYLNENTPILVRENAARTMPRNRVSSQFAPSAVLRCRRTLFARTAAITWAVLLSSQPASKPTAIRSSSKSRRTTFPRPQRRMHRLAIHEA